MSGEKQVSAHLSAAKQSGSERSPASLLHLSCISPAETQEISQMHISLKHRDALQSNLVPFLFEEKHCARCWDTHRVSVSALLQCCTERCASLLQRCSASLVHLSVRLSVQRYLLRLSFAAVLCCAASARSSAKPIASLPPELQERSAIHLILVYTYFAAVLAREPLHKLCFAW